MDPFDAAGIGRIPRETLAEAAANPNEGPVHRRIREALTDFARAKGFTQEFDIGPDVDGTRLGPDVALLNAGGTPLVGDAKDSRTERAGDFKPWVRVSSYLNALARHLAAGRFPQFWFLLATDDFEAAEEWRRSLDQLSAGFQLSHRNAVWELRPGGGIWVVN
jgi:hypothetical protein